MYTEHYGLSGRPFQLTPDPRFWFESATHRKAMAYLGYGLAQGEGFIVITGDIGAGKTTLVGHLMATIDRTRLTAVQLVSTQVEGDDVLRLTAQALGVPTEGVAKAQLLGRVERLLHEQAREGRRTLLVVDEAQNLAVSALEELRMLSNFQAGGQALVQIFLLGQPEFRERLQRSDRLEQLRQRVIATHHLEGMGADEIEPYIMHRLKLVGWSGRPRFTQDAFASLHHHSGGIPRRLNTLVTRTLLYGAIEDMDLLDGRAIEAVAADVGEEMGSEPAPVEEARPVIRFERRPLAIAPVPEPEPEPEPLPEPEPVPESEAAADPALTARLAALEARVEEQEAALRRVLTLLVDWVEGDAARPSAHAVRSSAA